MAFGFDYVDDLVNVLFAEVVGFGFHHDADHRLGAGFADKDTAGVAEGLGYLRYSCLYVRIVLCVRLTLNANVLENLRVINNRCGQL